jgi:hypothetical protein
VPELVKEHEQREPEDDDDPGQRYGSRLLPASIAAGRFRNIVRSCGMIT